MGSENNSIIIYSTIILLLMVLALVVIYTTFLNKKSKMLMIQQEKELEFEQELNESLVEMKEQTLLNVGQELHDNIGQKLSVVRLRSNQLSTKLEKEKKDELNEISQLLGETIQDLRDLSKTLIIDHINDFKLQEALTLEVKRINRLNFIAIVFSKTENLSKIPPKHQLIIYRMLQESLNNILKHSKAREVKIKISEEKNQYTFCIQDNGIGFDTTTQSSGSGLHSIAQRAKMIHTEYTLQSTLKNGTKITFKYPK